MGMFDEVICEHPLPGTPPDFIEAGHPFQTKDLDCAMDVYQITADGRLMIEAYDIEDQSDPNETGWRRAVGCMTRVNQRWEVVPDFTGTICFYSGNQVGG